MLFIIIININYEYFNNRKCCIINTEFVNNTSSPSGSFQYNYTISDNCDYNTYVDGINGWSNKNCNNNSNILGSCRYPSKECIDYVTKEYCDNLKDKGLIWSNKTCNDNIVLPINLSPVKMN